MFAWLFKGKSSSQNRALLDLFTGGNKGFRGRTIFGNVEDANLARQKGEATHQNEFFGTEGDRELHKANKQHHQEISSEGGRYPSSETDMPSKEEFKELSKDKIPKKKEAIRTPDENPSPLEDIIGMTEPVEKVRMGENREDMIEDMSLNEIPVRK